MKKAISFIEKNYLKISVLFYVLLCALTYQHYKYAIDPDGESYINLAVKYYKGNFKDAINGYWSPLVTWLITPFLFTGFSKFLVGKIVSLSIGLLALFITNKFISNLIKKNIFKFIVLFPSALFLFTFSNVEVGADVLAATSLLFYFSLLMHEKFNWSYRDALFIGISGAFCYFSKYYLLPFFLVHLTVTIIIKHFYTKEIAVFKKLKFVFVCFSILLLTISPWLISINKKYDVGLIFCTSGKVNLTQVLNGNWKIIDSKMGYFLMPNNSTAVDFTEDITLICGGFLGVFDSAYTFNNEVTKLKSNCKLFKEQINLVSLLNFTILFFLLFLLITKFSTAKQKKVLLFYFSVLLIYPIGYLMTYCEERYFIIIFIVTIVMGVWLLENYLFQLDIKPHIKILLSSLFIISFCIHPVQILSRFYDTMNYSHKIAERLKKEFHLKGLVYGEGGKYRDTQYACFAADLQNVIINPEHWNEREKLKDELQKNNINYYFYWHWKPDQSDTLSSFYNFEEITKGKIYGLQIFKITSP